MSIQGRVRKLERAIGDKSIVEQSAFDLTLLTDAELLNLNACYDENGKLVEERITPELEAALERVRR